MGIDEKSMKRMIRAMNSVLNLYDVEEIPDEIVEMLMKGVKEVATLLRLKDIALYDDNKVLMKYVMPEDFDAWLNNNGVVDIADEETE